jgi:hypothetical protein
LLADLTDRTMLTGELSDGLSGLRRPRTRHDPGRVLVDLAIAVADGAQTISDIAVLVDQPELFGPVASDSTCWRMLDAIGKPELAAIHRARAAARELAWAQRAEITGSACPPARAADRPLAGLVIDLDATIVVCHSDKQQAAPTFKQTFGYHPMVAFLDNTGEALAGLLRAGNAGANTAADHISVFDAALAQIPDAYPSWDAPAGPRVHRRVHQGFPGPHSPTAHPGDGHRVLPSGGPSLTTNARPSRTSRPSRGQRPSTPPETSAMPKRWLWPS